MPLDVPAPAQDAVEPWLSVPRIGTHPSRVTAGGDRPQKVEGRLDPLGGGGGHLFGSQACLGSNERLREIVLRKGL